MRREIQNYLGTRPDLTRFVRENPNWYRLLTRNPEKIYEIEQQSRIFYGKTFPQKIDRIQQKVQLAQMLMSIMDGMSNENG